MSKIIREILKPKQDDEFAEGMAICVLRSDHYGSSIEFFLELAAAAREDFPGLTDDRMEVKHFAGVSYKRMFGIEFEVPAESVPESYFEIRELERKL